MDRRALSETDIRTKYITPAIIAAGWDPISQLREEYRVTAGRVIARGKTPRRAPSRRADYVLFHAPNLPLAVIEAKDANHTPADGLQQALDYAERMDVPFVYSSNGESFIEHDRTLTDGPVTRELPMDRFPTPDELYRRYRAYKGWTPEVEAVATYQYHTAIDGKEPRYFQRVAINRTVEAIARGDRRILLVMATGTGKTYTAFQIIWRLWKSGAKKRILFLVDRNILADQTRTNDFKPFGKAMTKIVNRTIDKSYEIYLALYQAVTGTEDAQDIYREFSPDFFDLVIVDECHRGSAADDASWRRVLEYFSSATQIGMTATPKETRDVSNIDYFGEPLYIYSLRQGIEDGFLAPYRVIRVGLDRDLDGWRPEAGQVDRFGQLIEDREYNDRDFDRTLVLEQRTTAVAARITECLRATDRFAKTIVFCEDIDHAERMRQALVNANPDLAAGNPRYVMRITGDNDEGKNQLENFGTPESTYPVIATTSRLMTTGVDAPTCRLIVLDRRILSMTEFKQIIGRGTRISEDYGKLTFTIMDFKRATTLFADPDFDGEPVQIYEPRVDQPAVFPDDPADTATGDPDDPAEGAFPDDINYLDTPDGDPGHGKDRPAKYYVHNVEVRIATERVQYLDEHGKLITESLRDYTRRTLRAAYTSLDGFLTAWNDADRKKAILDELAEKGVFLDELAAMVGREYDAFDLICHVAWDRPPLTRRERADNVQKRDAFARYGEQARAVLEALLRKYADTGILAIDTIDVLRVDPIARLGTPMEITQWFGGKEAYLAAVRALELALYPKAA